MQITLPERLVKLLNASRKVKKNGKTN